MDGILSSEITTPDYYCHSLFWSLAISADETQVFVSAQKNGYILGAICKWDISNTASMDCLELGNLYVPLFINRIVDNKVFIAVNDEDFAKDLYFAYIDLDTNSLIWNK